MREPDQIDMMDEKELRKKFRDLVKENIKLKKRQNEVSPLEGIVRLLTDRMEEIEMKYKLAEGKPDGANGGGEAFWDGKRRELQTIIGIIKREAT